MLLILGVLLWAASHSIRHTMPRFRKALGNRQAKAFVSAASFVSIGLMIIGYRLAPQSEIYDLGPDTIYLNNLLMVIAIALLLTGTLKSRIAKIMRHPMLVGVVLWAIAHLLIAGEFRAIVLFGGLSFWAIATMIIINNKEPKWTPPAGTLKGDLTLAVSTAVLVVVIGALHMALGLTPFGG